MTLAALIIALVSTLVTVGVDTNPAHRLNTIRPQLAIGAGVDSDPEGKIPLLYSPDRVRRMLGAGLGFISYRLYTELSIQDWHWNPTGSFSDGQRGYWQSSSQLTPRPIIDSFGYTLPRRGDTEDQGDDDGYSRIADNNPQTYWKSNPYLTSAFTGEPDSMHPQWVLIDLWHPKPIDAIRIRWADPYARQYLVQYWTGGDAILAQASGVWHTFAGGTITHGSGGTSLLRLARSPMTVRFVRILMIESSNTCAKAARADRRNCVGYAVNEIYLGRMERGKLHDIMRHSTCGGNPLYRNECHNRQTIIFVSSIDPWHDSTDRVPRGQDQPGLDIIARSALNRGLPVMVPVPMFYSTPENAVAEIRYLHSRGYKVGYVEMGEEVDGQYAMPEDYAALYVQWARAIHAQFPHERLGGPIFQGVNSDVKVWPDAQGDASWLHRFLAYLQSHGRLNDLSFMSFEHYPFRGCDQGSVLRMDLLREPSLVRGIVETWRSDGLPANVPMFITESNFANNGGPVPKQLAGALWMADWIGTSLASGVSGINYYQYEAEPTHEQRQCNKYGGYGMFIVDRDYRILANAGQYYAAQMLTQEWLVPGVGKHELYPVSTDQKSNHPAVTAYAAHRPDGLWSVMLVNKDTEAHRVAFQFGAAPVLKNWHGWLQIVTFGSNQFHWSGDAATELPKPNRGLERAIVEARADKTYIVPPESITVIRGALSKY